MEYGTIVPDKRHFGGTMYIDELEGGREITLFAISGKRFVNFRTSTIEIEHPQLRAVAAAIAKKTGHRRFVFARTVYTKNRKVVNFNAPNVRCKAVISEDGMLRVWHTVKTIRIKIPYSMHIPMTPGSNRYLGSVLVLMSDSKSSGNNRRGSYRLTLGLDGHVKIGYNKESQPVRVRDISGTGIGFTISPSIPVKMGENVVITFSDALQKGRRTARRVNFEVAANVVRIEGLDESHTIIGCKMRPNEELTQYIFQKQMLLLSEGKMRRPGSRSHMKQKAK